MDGYTGDKVGKALMSFTQQVGVPDELVTNNQKNVSVSGPKWDQIFRDKNIRHILTVGGFIEFSGKYCFVIFFF